MNFLRLVQTLHRESGASGASPTTTVNQAGEYLRLRNWIIEADFNIQTMWFNWKFLQDFSFTYDTQAGVQDKTADTTLARWDEHTFKLDGDPIEVVEYEKVKHETFYTEVSDRATPSRIIIMPDNALRFDPVPDGAYTITADHWLKPVRFSDDDTGVVADNTKTSRIPEQYGQCIYAMALQYYGLYENSEDAIAHGRAIWDAHFPRLESDQLPNEFSAHFNSSRRNIEVIAE